MYIDKKIFAAEVRKHYATIQGQNSWAKKYFELEMTSTCPDAQAVESAERCWSLYVASRDNALGMLLLGEVSMRSKLALVQNFGLTSASGHEDEEPWLSPWLGFDLRDPASARPNLTKIPSGTLDADKNRRLQPLQGPGSILSDRRWTPLMNDAWLLGGVHKRQGFHLVTEGLGQHKLETALTAITRKLVFEAKRAKFDPTLTPRPAEHQAKVQAIWQRWFLDNPTCLYESWGPRVLVRELIGLMRFGYRPVFSRQELAFECDDTNAAEGATIWAYSEALNTLSFHQGSDISAKTKVLKALSNWLFGVDDAF